MRLLSRWFLCGVFSLGTALAGDRPEVRQVTFSADNAQVLVLTGWNQDGSGFPQAGLHLFDTGTGRQLFRLSSYSENSELTPSHLLGRMTSGQAQRFQKAGLLGRPASKPRFTAPYNTAPRWEDGLKAGQSKTYPVFLWSRPVPIELKVQRGGAACNYPKMLPQGDAPASFTVQVNGQPLTLPTGAALPCASRYALDRVDLSGNRVLLTIRAYMPGFEGPNAMPIFLAATLR